MPTVNYTTVIDIPRDEVWDFLRDMNNWAPLVKGYQSHEQIDERDSIWTVKADLGFMSRTTKARVHITEWIEGERVAFTMKGANEPIEGEGIITIKDANESGGTEIRGDATINFSGMMGPIANRLIAPMIKGDAEELVKKIAAAVRERSAQKS